MAEQNVSLSMIARNEEATLARCLASAADLVDEIVIADTGSTDRTKEIAASFGARVVDFEWIDDFAAARNESLKHARGRWVFWLDTDEWLDEENRERLRRLFAGLQDETAAYMMSQRSPTWRGPDETVRFDQARLFPNRPDIRWHYRGHEQILPAVLAAGGEARWTDVVIEHSGYQNVEHYLRKQRLYLRVLSVEDRERPNDPFTLFNIGSSHAALGDLEKAIEFWSASLRLAPTGASFKPKLYAMLAYACRRIGRVGDAVAVCEAGRRESVANVELMFQEGAARQAAGDFAGACAAYERLLALGSGGEWQIGQDEELHRHKTRHLLAQLYRAQKRDSEAEEQWKIAVRENPQAADCWLELGKLFLDQKRERELEEVLSELRSAARAPLFAELLIALRCIVEGNVNEGRAVFEAVIEESPGAVEPRVLLSRLQLQNEDWDAAEATLKDIVSLVHDHHESRHNLAVLRERLGRKIT